MSRQQIVNLTSLLRRDLYHRAVILLCLTATRGISLPDYLVNLLFDCRNGRLALSNV